MGYTVYILYSASRNRYYIGHTADLNDRFIRHSQGRSIATKSGVPWIIVHIEIYSSKAEAAKREYYIKSMKSRKYIESLFKKS
jgi:putative endonuclease